MRRGRPIDVLRYMAELERLGKNWLRYESRLTPEERQWIASGYYAVIQRPLQPSWEVGDWLDVASNLRIRVREMTWRRGFYRTGFDVQDFRPNFPRRVPPIYQPSPWDLDEHGIPHPPTLGEEQEASMLGSHTTSWRLAVPDCAENTSSHDKQRDRLKRETSMHAAFARARNRRHEDLIRYERRLEDARRKGRKGTIRVLESKVERVRSALRNVA